MSRANPLTSHDNAGIAAWNGVKVLWDAEFNDFDSALGLHDRIYHAINEGKLGENRGSDNRSSAPLDLLITKASKGNIYLRVNFDQSGTRYVAVVLYDSEIVRYYPDGTFSVDNCGFNTPTTMERVTQFTPDGWRVYHENKQLALHGPNGQRYHPATHDLKTDPEGETQCSTT